jgi:DNA-binding PadR family transcriptional regulator
MILGLLARHPWDGYQLHKWFKIEGRFYRANADQSHIYRMLTRLADRDWTRYEVDQRENRPDSKLHTITNAGRLALLDWARSPFTPSPRFNDPDFVTRIVFGCTAAPDSLVAVLTSELEARRAQIRLARFRDRALHLQAPIPELDEAIATDILEQVHLRGKQDIDNWVRWLERLLDRYEPEAAPHFQPLPA